MYNPGDEVLVKSRPRHWGNAGWFADKNLGTKVFEVLHVRRFLGNFDIAVAPKLEGISRLDFPKLRKYWRYVPVENLSPVAFRGELGDFL